MGFLSTLGMAVVDVALINIAFIGAYWMRYTLGIGGEVEGQFYLRLGDYLDFQVILSLVLLFVYGLAGVYRQRQGTSLIDEMWKVLGATSIGMMLTMALAYIFQGFSYSRGVVAFAWALIVVFLWIARLAKHLMRAYLRRRGVGIQKVLVVGGDNLGKRVMHVIATEPNLGYKLVGFLQENGDSGMGRFKCLGKLDDITEVVRDHQIDEVIIALPSASRRLIPEITEQCQKGGVSFKIVPDLYEMSLSGVDIDNLRGIPIVGVKEAAIHGLDLWLKRGIDIALSLLLLVLLSPLWALLALLIKLDSPGPILFKQLRVGKERKPFQFYKFRSMRMTAEEDIAELSDLNEVSWPLFKIKSDPRLTRVGSFLRRTSLDELPQLINVLKGEMSLVGPRPPLPSEVEKYEPWHMKRLEVAPGLTGLWQVSGRSDLPFNEMVMLDIYYIENWSLGLDFRTLLRTIPAVITGQGAY
jgi:exopolysaccharide biosynthesis polyprenyl glycosylphosphotransferase